jgi:hypothetical protein
MMTVLLGVLLGVLVFSWARAWFGLVPAIVALLLVAIEPNLVAHASLVTTDFGATTLVFGAVYFLWRTCRHASRANVIGLSAFCGLAMAAKYSALLLAPIVALLLVAAVLSGRLTRRRAICIFATVAIGCLTIVWAAYGFRYLPSDTPGWSFDLTRTSLAAQAPMLSRMVEAVDRVHLLPNAYTQGLIYLQASRQMPSFLAGSYSTDGWWYYFPIAFLIKTPIAVIVLTAVGLFTWLARARRWTGTSIAFVLLPAGLFLAAAMTSGINMGLRHILPIYPFVILLTAAAARVLLGMRRQRAGAIALAAVLAAAVVEYGTAYPHTLPFFNVLVGGSENGFRYLADSNLGWGSNLKPLKAWMDEQGVRHINLAYFGQADPMYYGIDSTNLPGSPGFIDDISRPGLPGYVAISPTILQGVYAPPHWRLWYAPFRDLEPDAIIGDSIRVYWLDEWPRTRETQPTADRLRARRMLGDALLFGLEWPERAVLHYREYLRFRPDDRTARANLELAQEILESRF